MWTNDQQNAIDAPVSDILVTAAAGSGKTAVMVERLIQRIIAPDGTDIDRMLVVTFTNAAASEIKERIASKIAEKLEENDSPRLKNQLVLINRAAINTIHSYCLDILKNNFHLLNLEPDFKVGDTADTAILRAKALSDVLDAYYEAEDPDFLRVINTFTKKRDDAIEGIITDIYDFVQSTSDPDGYLDECCSVYAGNIDKQLAYTLNKVSEKASYAAQCYKRALRLCLVDVSFEKVMETIGEELSMARNITKCSEDGWDKVYNLINDYSFGRISSRKTMDAEIYEEIKKLRNDAKDSLKEIMTDMINLPLDVIRDDMEHMRPCVEKLCQLVKEFSSVYAIYKRQRNIVDFNDIEHFALKLLTEPEFNEVAEAQRERFDEIYIDEYQDCNGVQEALFKAVSRERDGYPNMFMVGDMKQCIYRFRNANPMLFKNKSDTYAPYGEGGDYNKIVLSKNFRSRPQVLAGVNLIFSRIMSESVGELDYGEDEYLYNGASYETPNPDTEYIDVCIIDNSTDDDAEEKPAVISAEANLVADKIRKLVDSGYIIYDKDTDEYRPVRYRDIAVLMRGVRNVGEYFVDAMARKGIPSFCDANIGYSDTEEVSILTSLVKILNNPMDDINLVTVMRSFLYGFTDNQLLKIRNADRYGYFYEALVKYSKNFDALAYKVKSLLSDMEEYRRLASVMAIDEFLWQLMSITGYMEFIGTLPGAGYKKANVRAFINRASMFVANGGSDLSSFVTYADEITMSGDGQGAKLIGENDDVVRIMTIHKSKGLEFPVVFVSRCGNQFNTRDLTEKVLMHHELGLGVDFVDTEKRFSYRMMVKNAIKDKILEENLSEEMRLLYVALTRAREKLIITGAVNNYTNFMADIRHLCNGVEGKLHPRSVSGGRTYLKWICQAIYDEDEASIRKIPGCGTFRREVVSVYSLGDNDAKVGCDNVKIPHKDENSPYKGEVLRRLEYEYPFPQQTRLPRNITVTEIKRLHDTVDDDTYRIYRMPTLKKPVFASDAEKVSASRIGTLMHLCMEKLELTDDVNRDTIIGEISALQEAGIITAEEATCIDVDMLLGFFSSSVGRDMVSADKVFREVPFEILVEAEDIFPGTDISEKIVVQGMIDAYYIDTQGNVILVDYKTDRSKGMTPEEFKAQIADRYRLQINYYEKALRLLIGRGVYRKYIYLFDIGEAVEIN